MNRIEQQAPDPSAAQTIRCKSSYCLRLMGVPPNINMKKQAKQVNLLSLFFHIAAVLNCLHT